MPKPSPTLSDPLTHFRSPQISPEASSTLHVRDLDRQDPLHQQPTPTESRQAWAHSGAGSCQIGRGYSGGRGPVTRTGLAPPAANGGDKQKLGTDKPLDRVKTRWKSAEASMGRGTAQLLPEERTPTEMIKT